MPDGFSQGDSQEPATILVIDDQEDNLALLDAVLSPRGFTVIMAESGASGLEMAWSLAPDLVLLDLAMPVMDGFEVLSQLRADRRTTRTPVIVLTANYRDAGMIERGLRLGATEYLTKPLQTEELVVRLRGALRLAQAEQELARLRRDFASMLVHDMRAPLDGVRLALGALNRQEAPGTGRRRLIEQSVSALQSVGALMEDLLYTNQLEEEGWTVECRPTSLAEVGEASLEALAAVASENGLNLICEPLHRLPAVQADPALLRRVLDNLISNALKFTEQGEVRLTAKREGNSLRVAVHDTGPGIPLEARSQIFDRYYHVERRRTAGRGGFGLGLALCQRAVTAMGGEIGVESAEGQGSEFWFTLPVVAAARQA